MKTAALAVLLLTLSFHSLAADLGPEYAVSPANVVAAAHAQSDPDIASGNLRAVLAVWLDRRAGGAHAELYATALDVYGAPMFPYGWKVADAAYSAKITTASNNFLIVYGRPTRPEGELVSVLSLNAATFTEPVPIGTGTIIDLATAYASLSICAIVSDLGGALYSAVILDANGHFVRSVPIPHRVDAITTIGGGTDYLVSGVQSVCDGVHPCTSNVVATRLFVTPSSVTMKTSVVASSLPYGTRTAVAGGIKYAGLSWISEDAAGRFVEWAGIDSELNLATGPHRIHTQKELSYVGHDFRPTMEGAERSFVVSYPVPIDAEQTRHQLFGRSVSFLEALSPTPAFEIAETLSYVSASYSEMMAMPPVYQQYFLTVENGDIFVRTGSLSRLKGPTPIALASSLQMDAEIAVSGSTAMSVWAEGDSSTRIGAALHTPGIFPPMKQVAIEQTGDANRFAPSIASAGNAFFAVWCEQSSASGRVLGQRFTAAGTAIDAQPIVIAEPTSPAKETAIASDGTDFFVVWSTSGAIHGRRVRSDGTLEPAMQLSSESNYHGRPSLGLVWTSEMYIAAWLFDGLSPIILVPPSPPAVVVRIARVTSDGVLLDTSSNPTVVSMWGSSSSIALASNGNRVLLTWIARDPEACAYATLLTRDGFVSLSSAIACGVDAADREDLAAAWDGQSFLAAWNGKAGMRGIRVTDNGAAFDPMELSPAGARVWTPSLARFGDGVIAAYTRNAPESFGGVGRVFVRTVGTATTTPNRRTRAVRR